MPIPCERSASFCVAEIGLQTLDKVIGVGVDGSIGRIDLHSRHCPTHNEETVQIHEEKLVSADCFASLLS